MRVVLALAVFASAACGRLGFDDLARDDASNPAGDADGPMGVDHVETPTGWTVSVWSDFSDEFTYVPLDFVDGSEMYDNLPDWLYIHKPPYGTSLGVLAGRKVIELMPTSYVEHDFGQHAPNQNNLPDALRNARIVDDLDGLGPRLVATSSSDGLTNGDGTYVISDQWTIVEDRQLNNNRTFVFDPTGAFEGTPNGYLGAATGIYRRTDVATAIIGGDTKTMKVVGNELWIGRFITLTDHRLIGIVTTAPDTFTQFELAQGTMLRIGEGDPPAPGLAWIVLDENRVAMFGNAGFSEVVARSTDPAWKWQAAASPPPGHPLAGSRPTLYVLEGNRTLDIDRVLVFTAP